MRPNHTQSSSDPFLAYNVLLARTFGEEECCIGGCSENNGNLGDTLSMEFSIRKVPASKIEIGKKASHLKQVMVTVSVTLLSPSYL